MTEKRFYIVKDNDDKLVAIFTNEEDCKEFISFEYSYVELVI